jgi:hypothetical protein
MRCCSPLLHCVSALKFADGQGAKYAGVSAAAAAARSKRRARFDDSDEERDELEEEEEKQQESSSTAVVSAAEEAAASQRDVCGPFRREIESMEELWDSLNNQVGQYCSDQARVAHKIKVTESSLLLLAGLLTDHWLIL